MKRILFFLFLLCSLTLSAQEVDTTPHKHRFIELVNNGEFELAEIYLVLVEDWSLSLDNELDWLNTNSGLEFVNYLDSINQPALITDSLLLYISKNSDIMSEVHYSNYEYDIAIEYKLVSIDIIDSIYGTKYINYIKLLNELGNLYHDSEEYEKAEKVYLRALQICEDDKKYNEDYILSLDNIASLYCDLGRYFEAEKYYMDAISQQTQLFGEFHSNSIYLYANLALLYKDQGDFKKAHLYLTKSKKLCEKFEGKDNPLYASILYNLGDIYSRQGLYLEGGEYFKESLKIREKVLDRSHPDYVSSIHSIGVLYELSGNYKEAERFQLEALRKTKDLFGDSNSQYAGYLNDLGILYKELGNYSVAEQYFLESLITYKKVFGELHPSYAKVLSNLSDLYFIIEDYKNSSIKAVEALGVRIKIYGSMHPMCASSLCDIGNLYSRAGKFYEAEQSYISALKIQKDKLGELHPDYATTLHCLGLLYATRGDYSKSENCLLEVLEIRRKVHNDDDYKISLNDLGFLYSMRGDYTKSEKYILESNIIKKKDYLSSLNYMTEHERGQFWSKLQESFEYTYPLFTYRYHFTKPSISTFAYDNELFRKGLLLNSADAVRRSILESGDSALIKQWYELTSAKQVVMHMEENEPQSQVLEKYRNRADSLEKQMTISSAVFRESKEQWNINWESVKKQLSRNEVAIEYFSAPLSQDSTMYCALLLRHNSKYPELIPLFEGKEVTDIMSTINESIDNSLLYNYNKFGATLSEKVWSKILPRVKEGETIYFSPSGLLHQLAIEFLPVDSARTMSDVYNMLRLSSTREIVTNKSKESYKSAVVYGGVHYDLDNETMLTESNHYQELKHRSLENDSINRGKVDFLSGTKEEAEKINKLLADNKIEAKIFKTKIANEESFKSLSGKHNNILHIATHGFTWTDSTAREQDYFADRMKMQQMGDNKMRGPIIDPLDRCGLLFAGANTALQGKSKELPQGVQDGILTAKEISLMDLRGAELVVLSACETAQGDITSEGVFGLQRAFKMAGTKTIIMSLWKVDDNATQLLMTEFYTNWITKKQPKREAFRNAQNAVRYYKDEYGDYIYINKPYYWAGFIMLD